MLHLLRERGRDSVRLKTVTKQNQQNETKSSKYPVQKLRQKRIHLDVLDICS